MWKPIEGFAKYEVSAEGEIRSHKNGGRILKPTPNHRGYMRVSFYQDGKAHWRSVHRVVAQAFIPNPKSLPQVNHQDSDKGNNRADNLEWVTGQENIDHAAENFKRGSDHYAAKLTEPDVLEMRWLRSLGVAVAEIAKAYGVAKRTAREAITGKTWRHI